MRIHATTLAQSTQRHLRAECEALARSSEGFAFTDYALWRIEQRQLSAAEVLNMPMLPASEVALVEYRVSAGERSVLLRRLHTGLCAVYELDRAVVVTAYRNELDDQHQSLKASDYLFGGTIR